VEEVHIQDHLAHGRSRARVLQVAQFFRAAGISGGVGAADAAAAVAASAGNATAHQSGHHHHLQQQHHQYHHYGHQLQGRQQPSEGEAQAKAKRLNLRRKHDWI